MRDSQPPQESAPKVAKNDVLGLKLMEFEQGVAQTPDIWEVSRTNKCSSGSKNPRVRRLREPREPKLRGSSRNHCKQHSRILRLLLENLHELRNELDCCGPQLAKSLGFVESEVSRLRRGASTEIGALVELF